MVSNKQNGINMVEKSKQKEKTIEYMECLVSSTDLEKDLKKKKKSKNKD